MGGRGGARVCTRDGRNTRLGTGNTQGSAWRAARCAAGKRALRADDVSQSRLRTDFDLLNNLTPQFFEIRAAGRVRSREPFGKHRIMDSVVHPGGEVVVVLALIETRLQQAAPEMMIDGGCVHVGQYAFQLLRQARLSAGGQCDQCMIIDRKGFGLSARLG